MTNHQIRGKLLITYGYFTRKVVHGGAFRSPVGIQISRNGEPEQGIEFSMIS